MSDLAVGVTPRPKRLSSRRGQLLSVIDVGSHKIVCMIAELEPASESDLLAGRTHRARIIGIGHQRSLGVKRGAVVDLDTAEGAIRMAVDAAERMAKVEIRAAIVSLPGGRLWASRADAAVTLGHHPVRGEDIERVVIAAARQGARPGRSILHAVPLAFSLDGSRGIVDPAGMVGNRLGCDMTVVTGDQAAVRNLMLAVERCHVAVEAVVATPYAAGLACLVDDEAEMGVVSIDFGAGTTGIAVFEHGRLVHCDAVAVGGQHVTMDVARGLSTRVSDAERLKALYGSLIVASSDERDLITVPQVDEGERDSQNIIPKAQLSRIVKPRVEEILELVRARLDHAGFGPGAGRRVVLTGGASQLTGLVDLARTVFGTQVRLGRPLGVRGLPEAAKGPAFSAAVGLLVYPQVAGADRIDLARPGALARTGTDGYFARVTQWLRDSF